MASRARSRAGAITATALAFGGLVTSCADVPDRGPVRAGEQVATSQGGRSVDVRLLVDPPRPGLDPAEIVNGFLVAAGNAEGQHAVARTYLTEAAARAWDPSETVVVYDDSTSPIGPERDAGRGRVVRVRAPEIATIDAHGAYDVSPPGREYVRNIRLEREAGEWRIARPPAGLLLTELDLGRSYERLHVYFLEPGGQRVVPDDVFVPRGSTGRATALLRSQLRGPTEWLAPAVRSAVPGGTTLVGSAPVDGDGVLTVDLSREALAAGPAQRRQLSAQVVWTARQLPEVSRVRLMVEGAPFEVPDVGAEQGRDEWSSFDPNALPAGAGGYYLSGDRLLTLDGQPVPGRFGRPGLQLSDVALSPGSDLAAGLRRTGGGTALFVGLLSARPERVLDGARFSRPSWDVDNVMWVLDTARDEVFVYRPGVPVARVSTPGLPALDLRQLRVSRDGTRVVAAAGSGQAGRLLAARVRTAADGQLRLDGWRPIAPTLTDVTAVSWADASTVVALGRGGGAEREPWVVAVDGSSADPLTTRGFSSYDDVAAAPGQPTLVESERVVFVARRGEWAAVGRGRQPIYRG